jgi:hypothetical protein
VSIKSYLKQVLSQADIINLLPDKKVYFLHANCPKAPYIEYQVIDEFGDAFAENKEISTRYIIQVDIFSYVDYSNIEEILLKKMIESGFNRDKGADLYEPDTKLNHKAMRFNISLPTNG